MLSIEYEAFFVRIVFVQLSVQFVLWTENDGDSLCSGKISIIGKGNPEYQSYFEEIQP